MKTVTVDQVMAWDLCDAYDRARLEELFAGREALTAAEVAALDIPVEDRMCALLHAEFCTDHQMHELACRFAESVAPLAGDAEPVCRAAIAAKRAWLRGEIDDAQLAAAWAAARDTARDTAWAAAWAATRVAARAVPWDAAWAVPWSTSTQLAEVVAMIELEGEG